MANKRKHLYPLFTEVAFITPEGIIHTGTIISRCYKLPKSGNPSKEEPYYIITEYGPAVWENEIYPIDQIAQLQEKLNK